MNESGIDLETVATADLVNEIRRRSKVFFMCMRPMAEGEFQYMRSWGVDGGREEQQTEDLARVVGLIDIAKADLLYVKPTLDDLT